MEIAERHAGETDDSKGAVETKTVRVAVCVSKRRGKEKREREKRLGAEERREAVAVVASRRFAGRLEEERKRRGGWRIGKQREQYREYARGDVDDT